MAQHVPIEKLSIIICNFNYAQFVGQAIESALAVDWPDVEVIVVDDGSTDNSSEIIRKFERKGIKALFRGNKGQAQAAQEGFSYSSGDWILFLDADDLVHPSIALEASRIIVPGWSMIQFQMEVIDATGAQIGGTFPKFVPTTSPERIRDWASQTDSYPTSPGSGNMLSRSFLKQIFPTEDHFDRATDSYFLSTAPFLGKVLTVSKPLVCYRVHGNNDSAQSALDVSRITRDLARHLARCEYATKTVGQRGISLSPDRWRYGFYNLAMRVASLRLAFENHPIPEDSIWKCLNDAATAAAKPQGLSMLRHIAILLWVSIVASGPIWVAKALASWRFAPPTRPNWLRQLIRSA